MKKANLVYRMATIKDSTDTIWRVGHNVYRVSDETLDVNGMPQAKRWEADYDRFVYYLDRNVWDHLVVIRK
jgi:hypothetical protein